MPAAKAAPTAIMPGASHAETEQARRVEIADGARQNAPKRKPAPPAADDDEPVDMEALRINLARRIATLAHYPRDCPEPICRRNRRCLGRKLSCHRVHPLPQLTPEQEERHMAYVQHAIKRRLAELEAQGEVL